MVQVRPRQKRQHVVPNLNRKVEELGGCLTGAVASSPLAAKASEPRGGVQHSLKAFRGSVVVELVGGRGPVELGQLRSGGAAVAAAAPD